ncbi:MerR family transcriptional regulator [Streptomyces botrytidirepellens]|uniref:MerR family transcriptional regulator n=1 Tax=Streptomyces botrytidirepellens TaxID=2486417 RepID=A0A3M8T0S5_9ACTN|nr:MerR family transcriptional regulator [Streptomyces botrytidirepellens]RNF86633.1 MerR family transcriptional regulator [Streptomyces botrytidirepellens]
MSEADRVREYRVTELAERAGITVRTLRFYRERKLIPPPRREGRIAWYNDHHLARLRTITALLERGHTLGGIAELIAAFESGRDVGELLGMDGGLPSWSEETPIRLTPQALADYFDDEATAENLTVSLDIGYLAVDGDDIVHISQRLLDASRALVGQGIPLSAVLAAGREVREHVDAIAETFATLLINHVLADARERGEEVGETVERLRPLAKSVVDAELSMAMDRRLRSGLEERAGGRTEDTGGPPRDQ